MARLTYAQVYALARRTGLDHPKAIIATAIAGGESGLDPAAVGDRSLQTATWGPSVGLWQVRSLNADTGTGRTRDRTRLADPAFNARSMFSISEGGRDWSPWSVYKSGTYRKHLPAAQAAAGGGGVLPPETHSPTYPASTSGVSFALGNSPFDVDLDLGPLSGPAEGLIKAAGPLLLGSLIVAGGVGLVVVGLWKAAS